ncbi:MAG: HEAT repeat domain-containing protein, partial [Planctomycetes bacterium]|nr:HEAT repeat domain-containing protein [Planctomycetota bacterium]
LLLQGILDRPPPGTSAEDRLLLLIFQQVMRRQRGLAPGVSPLFLDESLVVLIAAVYRHLEPASSARELLPSLLTGVRSPRALVELADLMVDDPPRDPTLVAAAFGPLFQHDDYDPRLLFPRLLGGLAHSSVAAVVLDLANFLTRRLRLGRHPAADHASTLASLLGQLVGRLGQLESAPPEGRDEIRRMSYQINEGVSLAVSLCDALALIGDRSITGKLYQATELSHRRLRTEAAAALVRLGEQSAREMLVQMAAEPVVRLRVLAYAEENGVLDEVDERFKTDVARAEADLALWLAQPSQVGIPPATCEWIESRSLYWPGYDDPVDCHLFRFSYQLGDAEYSNIGMAGPAAYAFGCDLSDLPPDDIFAAFAGWHAEHEEMYEFNVAELHAAEQAEVARLARRLHDEGFEQIQPRKLCMFFGDRVLVADAVRDGMRGVAVADYVQTSWMPRTASSRPPGIDEAYCIYKGRRLLRSFNE